MRLRAAVPFSSRACFAAASVHAALERACNDLVLGDHVHHGAPARQAVAVLPAQQRLAHRLKQLLRALRQQGGQKFSDCRKQQRLALTLNSSSGPCGEDSGFRGVPQPWQG